METITITLKLTEKNLAWLAKLIEEDSIEPMAVPQEVKPQAKPDAQTQEKPPAEPEITLSDLRALGVKLTKAGKSGQYAKIFAEFDAAKLSEIKPEDYAAVYKRMEAL